MAGESKKITRCWACWTALQNGVHAVVVVDGKEQTCHRSCAEKVKRQHERRYIFPTPDAMENWKLEF